MKIDEIYRNLTIVQNSTGSHNMNQLKPDSVGPSEVKKGEQQDTKVEISDTSIAFNNVKEVLQKDDPERISKVQAIKEAIVQGTYRIDSGSVADKILKDSLANIVQD